MSDQLLLLFEKRTRHRISVIFVLKRFFKVSLLVWCLLENLSRGLNNFSLFLIISRHNLREHLHVVVRQMQLDGLARTDLELRQMIIYNLENILNQFKGSLIVVSHDINFLENLNLNQIIDLDHI